MLKDITLGQYFPGDTIVHRLDPRTKIIFILMYIIALFTSSGAADYIVMTVVFIVFMKLSNIKFLSLLRGVRPLIFVIALTAILNMFYTDGRVLAEFWIFKITYEGIINALFMALRITLLVMCTSLLTYTTSPIMLTGGLEKLLSPLKRVKVPVHELAMMMSMALRLIPTLIEETEKIMNAQKARGARFDTGNIIEKAKALLPILVPLFVSSFKRADELATAMESRCYHGGEGRTRLRELHMGMADICFIIASCCVMAAVVALK